MSIFLAAALVAGALIVGLWLGHKLTPRPGAGALEEALQRAQRAEGALDEALGEARKSRAQARKIANQVAKYAAWAAYLEGRVAELEDKLRPR